MFRPAASDTTLRARNNHDHDERVPADLVDAREQISTMSRELAGSTDDGLDVTVAALASTIDRMTNLERALRVGGSTELADDARRFAGGVTQAHVTSSPAAIGYGP